MILVTKTSDQTRQGHTYSKNMDHPGKVAKPARGQLNRENEYFPLSAFAPGNLVSRDGFGSPVPRQPAHPHTQADLIMYYIVFGCGMYYNVFV